MKTFLLSAVLFLACTSNTEPVSLPVTYENIIGAWCVENMSGGISGKPSGNSRFDSLVIRPDTVVDFYKKDTLLRSDAFELAVKRSILDGSQKTMIISVTMQFEPLIVTLLTPGVMELKENCVDCYSYKLSRKLIN